MQFKNRLNDGLKMKLDEKENLNTGSPQDTRYFSYEDMRYAFLKLNITIF